MEDFIRSYGLWILLAAVFVGMHWFGMGCGGGHRHAPDDEDAARGNPDDKRVRDDKASAHAGHKGGCH